VLIKRCDEVMERSQKILDELAANSTGLKELFDSATGTLTFRRECLQAAFAPGGERPDESKADEHQAKLSAFRKSSGPAAIISANAHEPCEKFMDLDCLSMTLKKMSTYSFKSDEAMRTEKKRLKEIADSFRKIPNRCAEQVNRLSSAFNKKLDRQIETTAAERMKREKVAQESKTKEEARARIAKTGSKKDGVGTLLPVIDLKADDNKCKPIPVLKSHVVDNAGLQHAASNGPFLLDCSARPVSSELSEELTKFHERFKVSSSYSKSGRGAEELTAHLDQANTIIQKLDLFGKAIAAKMGAADRIYLGKSWMHGCEAEERMVGPEYAFLTSMKLQVKGSREVKLASFEDAFTAVRKTKADTATWSLQEALNVLGQMNDQKDFDSLCENGAVFVGKVEPSQMLVVPAGWIVISNVLNKVDNLQLRWVRLPCALNASFTLMVKMLIDDPAAVKTNSAQAFLVKVFQAAGSPLTKRPATGGSPPPQKALKSEKAS